VDVRLLEVDGDAQVLDVRAHPRQPARADSFMTSPSWPVRIRLPLPASRRLDEEDVAAGGHPGQAGRHAGISVRSAASE
jgi:hypothetical protein